MINNQNLVKESVSSRSRLKGSISAESSMVVPLFLFFMITVMSLLIMSKEQSEYYQELHQEALSEYGSSAGGRPGGMIEKSCNYVQYPAIRFFPFIKVDVSDRVYMHPFTGYTGSGDVSVLTEPDEFVYVTKTGTKYHRLASCTYINIKPRSCDGEGLQNTRNKYGRRYRACDICHPGGSGMLFITGDGECYHCRSDCPGLKRTVYMITLKEAISSGYTACSKCG
ncbi:MAG: hypothetical protein K5888_00410 [Lachnospiraceae bacterium]|nr:hypothetical protein [Lachnospiraceae bacterium]